MGLAHGTQNKYDSMVTPSTHDNLVKTGKKPRPYLFSIMHKRGLVEKQNSL